MIGGLFALRFRYSPRSRLARDLRYSQAARLALDLRYSPPGQLAPDVQRGSDRSVWKRRECRPPTPRFPTLHFCRSFCIPHSEFLGTLLRFGTLSLFGSLPLIGTLNDCGSLLAFGTLTFLGSLPPHDTLKKHGSLLPFGTLTFLGSLPLIGTLNDCGSLPLFRYSPFPQLAHYHRYTLLNRLALDVRYSLPYNLLASFDTLTRGGSLINSRYSPSRQLRYLRVCARPVHRNNWTQGSELPRS